MFVKYDGDSGQWYDIGDKEARKKCGHAIRDRLNQSGNPVRGSKAKARASRKKLESASDSEEPPKLRRKRRGGRTRRPSSRASSLEDDSEQDEEPTEAEAPTNITDSADTTICTSDDPIDLAIYDDTHHDDAMLFDGNLLDEAEHLQELEGDGSKARSQRPLELNSGVEFPSANASSLPGARSPQPGSNQQQFEMMSERPMHSDVSLPPHYASTIMQMPLMGTMPLPHNNTINSLDNSIVAIRSMMNKRQQQQQTPYSTFGSSVHADPTNPLPLTASDTLKQPPNHQSSATPDMVKSSDTSMEPLPFDAAEPDRYAIMNGGMLDGKIHATHSFDMGPIHQGNEGSSHQAAEGRYSLKDEEDVRKICVDGNGNGQSSARDDHLKRDAGHGGDFLSKDFFED
ncbi:MAG: hypothetical protein SGILL_006128 [Bacillariaceae sp.]